MIKEDNNKRAQRLSLYLHILFCFQVLLYDSYTRRRQHFENDIRDRRKRQKCWSTNARPGVGGVITLWETKNTHA